MKKLLIFPILILLLLVGGVYYGLNYLSQNTAKSPLYFPRLVLDALNHPDPNDHLNIMVLGLDRRDDWLEKTQTTDTIILAHLNYSQSKIHLFSLPRDLWDYPLNTKINQIYPLSLSQPDKFDYIESNFASISGQKIDKTLILSTDNLKQLADLLGGIDIYLDQGFIDKKYPNQDYIDNPKSGAPIYKTVEFDAGWVHLDSYNITEFVRSRKSAETAASGGTDLGRIERQQQLINALIDKLKATLTQNPTIIFPLYRYWQGLEHNFTDEDLIKIVLKLGKNIQNISIERHSLPAGEDPKTDLIYHPKTFINAQWVFIPQDKNYSALHQYISDFLH